MIVTHIKSTLVEPITIGQSRRISAATTIVASVAPQIRSQRHACIFCRQCVYFIQSQPVISLQCVVESILICHPLLIPEGQTAIDSSASKCYIFDNKAMQYQLLNDRPSATIGHIAQHLEWSGKVWWMNGINAGLCAAPLVVVETIGRSN